MATEKQIAANRANAQHSTGPRSGEGKAISSRNGLTHGLTASHSTVAIEKNDEFRSIFDSLLTELQPEGEVERSQVHAMAAAEWRHRRALRFDIGLTDVALSQLRKTRQDLGYADDPAYDDRQAWSNPDFLERREIRLLGETFGRCGMALLRTATYSTKFRREYDSAYSKLIINQDRRWRLAKLEGPESAD